MRIRLRKNFKFENTTPVQNPAIIDPNEIHPVCGNKSFLSNESDTLRSYRVGLYISPAM